MKESNIAASNIIEYWRLIEFLNQKAFPIQSKSDRELRMKASKGEKLRSKMITLYERISLAEDIKVILRNEGNLTNQFPITGSSIHVLVGKIDRQSIIDTFFQKFTEKESVEKTNEKICLFSLKVNSEGTYTKSSFRVSPLLWGLAICCKYPNTIKTQLSLDAYQKTMDTIEEIFFKDKEDIVVDQSVLESIHNYICRVFVRINMPDAKVPFEGTLIYTCFKTREEFEKKDDTLEDISELMTGFFQKDYEMILHNLQNNISTSGFLEYITILHNKGNLEEIKSKRYNIRENNNLIAEYLDPIYTPMGKWPSKFAPALMQQIAINLYLDNKSKCFSVNGPPGTGKTTLLKEIVAHNVVERALMLTKYSKADDAFIPKKFNDGNKVNKGYDKDINKYHSLREPKIADYNMLVTSSNNAAVENITKELPNYKGIVSSLDADGMEEINDLFNQAKDHKKLTFKYTGFDSKGTSKEYEATKKDIYFSSLAHHLKNSRDDLQEVEVFSEWGLISAPLGKRANLNNYYFKVMKPIMKHIKKHKMANRIEFDCAKTDFIEQYKRVEKIQQALSKSSRISERNEEALKDVELQKRKCSQHIENVESRLAISKKNSATIQEQVASNQCQCLLMKKQIQNEESNWRSIKGEQERILRELELQKSIVMELEDKRKPHEILLGKWIKSQRMTEIQEKKNEIAKSNKVKHDIDIKESKQRKQIKLKELELTIAEDRLKNSVEKRRQEEKVAQRYFNDIQRNLENIRALNQSKVEIKEIFQAEMKNLKTNLSMVVDAEFFNQLHSQDEEARLSVQLSNPWISDCYNREREKLFYRALQVNKYFILSSQCVRENLINLGYLWQFEKNSEKENCHFSIKDKKSAYIHLLNTIFLITPVISTTFASVSRFLANIEEPDSLGQLIVDEAGQATPQMAAGALWRFKKAIIVGDPKQVEPIVTDDIRMLMELFADEELVNYKDRTISVQSFADNINRVGAYLPSSEREEDDWVGCPLLIHRRCLNPMFHISNQLSYDNTMLCKTIEPKQEVADKLVYRQSRWLNILGKERGNKNHHVDEQASEALKIIERAFEKQSGCADIFVISPFSSVITGFIQHASKSDVLKSLGKDDLDSWLNNNCGTVHRFQGKEANEVIFLLGCDATAKGAVNWVNDNIVNVAVTRAKYRLYVIGDETLWRQNQSVALIQRNTAEQKSTKRVGMFAKV